MNRSLFFISIILSFLLLEFSCQQITPTSKLSFEEKESLAEKYQRVGSYYNHLGEYDIGNTLMDSALMLYSSADLYRSKAPSNVLMGNYHEAFTSLNYGEQIDPTSIVGYRGWLKLYFLRDYQGAIEDLTLFDSLIDGPAHSSSESVRLQLGIAHKQLGNYEQALVELDSCIVSEGNAVPEYAFIYRGLVKAALGDTLGAMDDYATVIVRRPNIPESYYWRAQLLFAQNKNIEGCEDMRLAMEKAKMGLLRSNRYREVIDQVYLSDIEERIEKHCPN